MAHGCWCGGEGENRELMGESVTLDDLLVVSRESF